MIVESLVPIVSEDSYPFQVFDFYLKFGGGVLERRFSLLSFVIQRFLSNEGR